VEAQYSRSYAIFSSFLFGTDLTENTAPLLLYLIVEVETRLFVKPLLITIVAYLLILLSLPTNGSTCKNAFVLITISILVSKKLSL
jgi:hypothetical protein